MYEFAMLLMRCRLIAPLFFDHRHRQPSSRSRQSSSLDRRRGFQNDYPSSVRTASLVAALLLAACSGDERDASPPTDAPPATDPAAAGEPAARSDAAGGRAAIEIVDPGEEPRVRLGIEDPEPVAVSVLATRRNEGSVGDQRLEDTIAAHYVLRIDLVATHVDGGYVARFHPTILETTGFVAGTHPGSWEWRLTANGVLTDVESPPLGDVDADRRLAELLSAHALFLMVPAEPVGAGATWTYAKSGADPVTVRLETIGDDELTATLTLQQQGPGMRFDSTATGSWLRDSLAARRVAARIDLSITATTTRNGEEVDVRQSTIGELVYEADR
jgi:hypothetical protein